MENLLPCPGCGNTEPYLAPHDNDSWGEIICGNKACGWRVALSSIAIGMKQWNTRSPQPSAGVQEVEVSEEEVAAIIADQSFWNTETYGQDAAKALRAKFSITPKREG